MYPLVYPEHPPTDMDVGTGHDGGEAEVPGRECHLCSRGRHRNAETGQLPINVWARREKITPPLP